MRIGVSLRSGYVVDDPRRGAEWMIERARAARDAGFDSLFVGDHHATPISYFQNAPILGRLLAEWEGRLAGALYLLPLWNPVLVAEQVGTLAALTRARFVMQCAIGGGDEQFAAMGVELRDRVPLFEAGLARIRALLAGEGDPVTGARVGPLPSEPVEVWIGGHAPRAIDRAARLGDVWYAGPEVDVASLRSDLEHYSERCAEYGVSPSTMAVRRDVHVADSDAAAQAVAGPIIERGYRGMAAEIPLVGGVRRVAEAFAELAEIGFTEVIVRHLAPEQQDVLASFEHLGEVRRLVEKA